MDTNTPIGISEFFRITRHATSHQIRKDAPRSALSGSNLHFHQHLYLHLLYKRLLRQILCCHKR